jgi:hypothetical protein
MHLAALLTSTDVDSQVEIGSHADNNNSVDSEIRKDDIPGTISGSMGRHFLMVGNAIFEGKSDEEPFAALNLTLAGIAAQRRALRKPGRDSLRPALASHWTRKDCGCLN